MIFIYIILSINLCFPYEEWYNHSELEWKTMETEHFIITFHQGTERSAGEVANIAEIVFEDVTNLYGFVPKAKTTIIIKDVDDSSNGAAYFFDNKILISGKPMDYDLRGAHRWIQDVITHEYVHIVQLGASMKYSRHIPGSYLQVLEYEDEKREDVLYGYPNQIISYPIPNTTVPPWFAEGVAQYMFEGANYDYWDSIRDMILRDRVLNNNLLSYDEMNTFGKTGIGNESAYNQGFSLVKYIVKKYGEDVLRQITVALSDPFTFSIDKAIKNTLGLSGREIYDDWKNELEKIYFSQTLNQSTKNEYTILQDEGSSNIHPVWSPDGNQFAFLSNKSNDYFSKTALYIYSFEDSTKKKIKLEGGVKSAPTWINDSLIVYSRKSKPDINGSKFFDLYSYDLIEEKEKQLTEGLRLFSPFYDRKNDKIYAINTYDGSCNIIMGNEDFSDYNALTNFNDGTQIFSLHVDDSIVYFDAVINHGRDIYKFNNEDNLQKIVDWDRRDPISNGNMLLSSNDKYGVFNLHRSNNLDQGYLTNVSGGAFMPDISLDGKILFSLYEDGQYKIALLENIQVLDESTIGLKNYNHQSDFNNYDEKLGFYNRPTSNLINEGKYSDISDYKIKMSGPFIMPRLMFDKGVIKPGLYLFDNDFLDKMMVLSGVNFNKNKDFDIFLLFEHKNFKLSYFFDFYFVARNVSRSFPYITSTGQVNSTIKYHMDFTYHLFLADIGTKYIIKDHQFWFKYSFSKYRQFYNVKEEQTTLFSSDYQVGDGAHNYFDGQSITIDYEYDARPTRYLDTMIPRKGFLIKSTVSYEKNNIFEEWRANERIGWKEYLAPNNTARYSLDVSSHWTLKEIKKKYSEKYIAFTNRFQYMDLSKKNVDDFLYFFGGGLPGIKGYSFYDPLLQGPNLMLMTNSVSYPIFTERAHKFGFVYLNSLSISLIHQFGKASSGQIITYSGHFAIPNEYSHLFPESTKNYLKGIVSKEDNPICYGDPDALDKNNCIPNELEPYIYPDIYFQYDGWENPGMTDGNHLSIKDLKENYKSIKQSIGIELKLYGFSFYSYPTALTYEYHIPISDSWNSKGRHYLRLLFDFS